MNVAVVDAKAWKPLALENGKARCEDAVLRNPIQKKQIDRNPITEAKSVLAEIAVALYCGVDPNSLVLFVPREWNGTRYVLPESAKQPDVGRIEVRRSRAIMDRLDVYGKDYVRDAIVLHTVVEEKAGMTTGRVFLTGFNEARTDWKHDRKPTSSHWYKQYPSWSYAERRDIATLDKGWAV